MQENGKSVVSGGQGRDKTSDFHILHLYFTFSFALFEYLTMNMYDLSIYSLKGKLTWAMQ